MATSVQAGGHPAGFAGTRRTDTWWVEPILQGLGFLVFVLYTTWAMFQAEYYYSDPYLSPFYSPLLFVKEGVAGGAPLHHAWFGAWPSWWPNWLPPSPGMLILVFPLAFRMTCYYYRKFYYRSYFLSPPACAVGAIPQKTYTGETGLLIVQNVHRYTMYIALIFILLLSYDAALSFFRGGRFGIGLGSIILTINPILLAGYTLGCHSLRHLVGGKHDCFSCAANTQASHKVWSKVSWLNHRHMGFAWASMIWVMVTDLYVRLVSMGIIHDPNTWGS